MAFSFSDMKAALRGLLGAKNTRVSGDGGGNVPDHVARLSQRYVPSPKQWAAAAASGTSTFAADPIFVAHEECNVVGIYVVQSAAGTLTATDYIVLNVIKRKSSQDFSLTENVATFKLGQTDAMAPNVAGAAHAFTLATTASVIDMDAGDTLTLNGTLNGTNLIGNPAVFVSVAVEEK